MDCEIVTRGLAHCCPVPACGGSLHKGEQLPPEATGVGDGVWVHTGCGRAARPCDRCGGLNRCGALYCRICGHKLTPHWRRAAFEGLPEHYDLSEPFFLGIGRKGGRPLQLMGTDAWIVVQHGSQVDLVEPGGKPAVWTSLLLKEKERVLALTGETGDWRLLTGSRILRLQPSGRFEEAAACGRGEAYLWSVGGTVAAYYAVDNRTRLLALEDLREWGQVEGKLIHPVGRAAEGWIALSGNDLVYGEKESLTRVSLQRAPHEHVPPVWVAWAGAEQVLIPTESDIRAWQPGLRGCYLWTEDMVTSLVAAGDKVLVLKGRSAEVWDAPHENRLLELSGSFWGHPEAVGDVAVIATMDGAASQVHVIDLRADPTERASLQIGEDLELVYPPRLAPGGVVALAARGNDLGLLWLGITRGRGGAS